MKLLIYSLAILGAIVFCVSCYLLYALITDPQTEEMEESHWSQPKP